MARTVAAEIGSALAALRNCERSGNMEWAQRHTQRIDALIDALPHGSGIDGRTALDYDASKPERIVITTEYHHMTEHGYYDGWGSYRITAKPSFVFGVDVRVTGSNRDGTRDYLGDIFGAALTEEAPSA